MAHDQLNSLRVLFWNARGIESKAQEVTNFIISNRVDILCVCETFLKGNQSFKLNGYKSFTLNRTETRLGGL